jgi:small subunit ribosomal protein S1
MGVTGLGSIEFYRSYSRPSRHRPSPDFGAFIEIKEGVDCLIHVSDMSWISLSMKHLEDDPWENVARDFPVGKEVPQAKIARLLERGVIVEVPCGIEGFIPTSKLTTDNLRNPAGAFKPGDTVSAAVIEVDGPTRKLTLSVTDYFKNKEDAEWKSYLAA